MSVSLIARRARLFLALSAAAGCAQNYATGVGSTREPLAYDGTIHRQGKSPIDEHDFYRIAGEQALAASIAAQRERGIQYNRAGLILMGVGLAGLGAMVALDGDARRIGAGLALALPVGGTMTFYGRASAERRPMVSSRRAREVADRYNAGLGRQP